MVCADDGDALNQNIIPQRKHRSPIKTLVRLVLEVKHRKYMLMIHIQNSGRANAIKAIRKSFGIVTK
jgi:hypothetical protein